MKIWALVKNVFETKWQNSIQTGFGKRKKCVGSRDSEVQGMGIFRYDFIQGLNNVIRIWSFALVLQPYFSLFGIHFRQATST